ncbi:MAG: hypothetical protein WBW80_08175 [Acidimicrobiales bacterium]
MFVIWILVAIFGEIFRNDDTGGGARALRLIFVIVLPSLGLPVYLIANGGKMQQRSLVFTPGS